MVVSKTTPYGIMYHSTRAKESGCAAAMATVEGTTDMNKFFMIVGIIVVAWLALGLIGMLFGFLVKAVFWIAVIAGIAYIVATIFAKVSRKQARR